MIYLNLIAEQRGRFEIVAAADPVPKRVEAARNLGSPDFLAFPTADDLLACDRLADIVIIATHDNYHYEPCVKAIEKGYHVLLEKPMTDGVRKLLHLERLAREKQVRVVVCHVLRYTSFYRHLKALLDAGTIGEVVSFIASEGIEPWHMAHSYVRGHWSRMEHATPTIVAKCCHDMDILHWLVGRLCTHVSSAGGLQVFTAANKPARAPAYCLQGCETADSCAYNAQQYITKYRATWLPQVLPHAASLSDSEVEEWLAKTPWGKCVYQSDNDAVDHQTLSLQFEGGAAGIFLMTAFASGRHYEFHGTRGMLRAGSFYREQIGADIIVTQHFPHHETRFTIEDEHPHPQYGGYHYGGDVGMIGQLYNLFTSNDDATSSIQASVHSHVIAFAAEEARRSGRVISLAEFLNSTK